VEDAYGIWWIYVEGGKSFDLLCIASRLNQTNSNGLNSLLFYLVSEEEKELARHFVSLILKGHTFDDDGGRTVYWLVAVVDGNLYFRVTPSGKTCDL
jgi:hypothetical protein